MARLTPKMSLNDWNSPGDPYSYRQLDQNWQIIDFHDHTPGRGVQIPAGGIAPGAIGNVQLAPGVATVQTGSIILWPNGNSVYPSGFGSTYLLCDGSQYQISLFAALYGVIGLAYSISPPSGYFNVPALSLGPPSYSVQFLIKT